MTENEPHLPMMDDDDGPGPGHNNPPEPIHYDAEAHATLKDLTDRFISTSDVWKKTEITTEKLAGQLNDQINGLRQHYKNIDAQRAADKKPHDDAGKAVQAAYKPLMDLVERAANDLKPILAKYVAARAAAEEAEREKERAAARAAAEEARMKAMEAEESGSIADKQAAEDAEKEAQKAAKSASRPVNTGVQSGSGAGRTMSTRSRRVVQIDKLNLVYSHYKERPEVRELLQRLATAEANAAGFGDDGTIPGCTITKTTTIA